MFDKLDDLLIRFEEVLNELGEPGVTDNQEHFQKLMKEQSDLQPIVDAYREYKKNKETINNEKINEEEVKLAYKLGAIEIYTVDRIEENVAVLQNNETKQIKNINK